MPGGFQPRAALGYTLVAALEAAALCGTGPSLRDEIEAAATLIEQCAAEWGPDAPEDSEAKALARTLHGTVPIVVGAELAGSAAYRWKCQFNENAKLPSWHVELPEADHNEIVGWPALRELGRFTCVLLDDTGAHPRNVRRAELTARMAGEAGLPVVRVPARGETALERLVSLVLLGDLVSLYAAVLRGADPGDVAVLDRLKAALADG
jgi:glucose/mannose-6-phosphate isomerase